ncbi:MAG: immune inhibitor A, partial [Actinomycetota bacterium]|nr:immune inhibitor A [Actinomycetota bacterium]
GNLKVSVNDGAFEVVPDSAYIFNKPNATIISAAAGNTNPLQGQRGFTGTDGGEVTGSWGQSQIDLTMIGAQSGDSVELRFDFGMDGCGAVDGWYVDDVTVSTCKAPTKTTAEHVNRPTRQGTAPRVKVTVESLGGQGDPQGQVLVRRAGGRILDTASLFKGDARLFLPKNMGVGVHDMVARYRGSDLHSASRDAFTVRVVGR